MPFHSSPGTIQMKETRTTTARLVLGDDGILRIYPNENAVISLEDAKNHFLACSRLTEGKKIRVLVYGNVNYKVTREAQRYSATLSHTRIATAVVTNKLSIKWMNFVYVWLRKPRSPVQVFRSETKAIAWLLSFSG